MVADAAGDEVAHEGKHSPQARKPVAQGEAHAGKDRARKHQITQPVANPQIAGENTVEDLSQEE